MESAVILQVFTGMVEKYKLVIKMYVASGHGKMLQGAVYTPVSIHMAGIYTHSLSLMSN